MTTDFGRDLHATTTLDTTRVVRGIQLYINGLLRRLRTRRATLYFHPNYGSFAEPIGESTEPEDIARLEAQYRATVEADPRTAPGSAVVTVTPSSSDASTRLDVRIECESDAGPIDLVLSVDKLTLAILGIRRSS